MVHNRNMDLYKGIKSIGHGDCMGQYKDSCLYSVNLFKSYAYNSAMRCIAYQVVKCLKLGEKKQKYVIFRFLQ